MIGEDPIFYEALIGIFGFGEPLPSGSLAAFSAGNPAALGSGRRKGQSLATPFLDFTMKQETRSVAVFGEGKYHITDDFALTVGGRWTQDKKDAVRSFTSNYTALLDPSMPCVDKRDSDKWQEVTGNAIAEYKLNADAMVFGKVSSGFKAGGFNIGECGGSYDPEKILAYEVGLKSRFLDNQMQANVALFYYDYDDVQVLRYVGNTASVENAAKGKIFGLETEFVFVPNRVPGLRLSGSLGYLNTEYDDASFSDPISLGDPIDVSGNRMMRAPEWKVSLATEYGLETHIGDILLMADWNFTDHYYFDMFEAKLPNQSQMKQPSYAITNIRASWTPNQGGYEVALFMDNVTDELYADNRATFGAIGGVYGEFSAPRTWGVRFAAKWQ